MMDLDVVYVDTQIKDLVQYVPCVVNDMKKPILDDFRYEDGVHNLGEYYNALMLYEKTNRPIKVLELFAGSRSVGKAAESLGYEVFSVDWMNYEGIDLSIDIGELTIDHLPFIPDIIWASPDCTTYTIAACSTHRTNSIEPKSEYAVKCDEVNKHWLALIEALLVLNPDLVYYIENPRGMLRKMPFMQSPPIRHTVWYCQYGDTRAKPTDIWTNNKGWKPRPECHNYRKGIKHCHHEAAPRGSRTGTQGLKGSFDRSKIPSELCLEVLNAKVEV